MPLFNETIIAQCTPIGSGALALLRLSGPQALQIATVCARLSSGAVLKDVTSHTIHHGWVVNHQKEKLDEVLFFVMHAPRTFTGEDVVEISCHNNQFLVQEVIEQFLSAGARIAQNGEFSRRAFENNKLDMVQAEAINDLIHAQSQQGLKKAFSQLQGSFSHWIADIEHQLIGALALSESTFEFLEDDIDLSGAILRRIDMVAKCITQALLSFDQRKMLKEGVRIALVGTVNAGKSSLFNGLLDKKRAIVTNIAGTTRDVIETGLYVDGLHWTLVDTAGIRTTDDIIEQEGIEKSYQEAALADIVLLVYDGSLLLSEQQVELYKDLLHLYRHKLLIVATKCDVGSLEQHALRTSPDFSINCYSPTDIARVKEKLKAIVQHTMQQQTSPFMLNQRHYNALITLQAQLKEIHNAINNKVGYEIVSYHLKDALALLSELTGKTISEQALDRVFKEFCVGK